jgi:radical SAM-linked protein
MAFISHLDLQRAFLRALRAAGLRPAYTEGFHPHPKMSIALPLSLGFESEAEYLEIETDAAIALTDMRARLNSHLPAGLTVTGILEREPDARKTLAASVRFAEYEILAPHTGEKPPETADWLAADSIFIEKTSRKTGKTTRVDIRPQIRSFECVRAHHSFADYRCVLSAQGGSVLGPLTLMEAWCAHIGQPFDPTGLRVLRKAIILE